MRILAALIVFALLVAEIWSLASKVTTPPKKVTYSLALPSEIQFPDGSGVDIKTEDIKNPILGAALRSPGISDLSIVKKQRDPLKWLERAIKVGGCEISLTGEQQHWDELQKIVSAVATAYWDDLGTRKDRGILKGLKDLRPKKRKFKTIFS